MLEKQKERLLYYGRKMLSQGLVSGSGGNLSILERRVDKVVITPSGVGYNDLQAADMVVCDRSGRILEGGLKPSSEMGFHLALYDQRSKINAVVHTHSVYATTLACLHMAIPAVHYLVGFAGNKVPLAPYATFGTKALARSVVDAIGSANAVLLANHGLVAVGEALGAAFSVAEEIEFVARIYYQTLAVGDPKILSDNQMAEVLEKFKTYGR